MIDIRREHEHCDVVVVKCEYGESLQRNNPEVSETEKGANVVYRYHEVEDRK